MNLRVAGAAEPRRSLFGTRPAASSLGRRFWGTRPAENVEIITWGTCDQPCYRAPPVPIRARLLALASGLLPLALALLALQVPRPLFLNLGPGDERLARGFQDWERDGLTGAGETMFRWALDGARLEWPVVLSGDPVRLRYRAARFTDQPADVVVLAGGREAERSTQRPSGWRVREVDLGPLRGPFATQWRAEGDASGLAVAVDWVELTGAQRLWPTAGVLARLALLCLVVPFCAGRFVALVLAVVAPAAIALDRLGGLLALADAALPALLAAAALALFRREEAPWRVPLAAGLVALVALAHPGFHYPDVDTHARFLDAARRQPTLWLDPAPYQLRTGAWTREIAGRKVGFPYATGFHLLAWPLALIVGSTLAVKALGVGCLAATLRLTHTLAGRMELGPRAALAAQVLVALLPVSTSRLTLALYPALLGQALELAVVLLLAGPAPGLGRQVGAWLLALGAYTGSLINVSALTATWSALSWRADRPRVLRTLAVHAGAMAAVLVVLYARFLPVLVNDVVPAAFRGAGAAEGELPGPAASLVRLHLFYDTVPVVAALAGLWALRGASPAPYRALAAAFAAGLGLLVLRPFVPGLLRDAKEVELLAAPLAVLAMGAGAWLAARSRAGAAATAGAALVTVAWALARDLPLYTSRFLAVGR
jgi:hypothetical protein